VVLVETIWDLRPGVMDIKTGVDRVVFWPGHPLSYTTTKVAIFFNDIQLSTATAFVMRYGQTFALVTNWHVLSGFNAATGECLTNTGAIPNRIECHVTVSREIKVDGKNAEELFFKPLQIGLFSGETPVWRDDKGQLQNDYAIIDLTDFLPELKEDKVSLRHILGGRVALRKGFAPAQSDVFSRDDLRAIYPTIGAEVFVLGYPRGIASTGVFPIWKRASIASEPQGTISLGGTSYKNLFYIDGLTKSGMSGSPVVCLAKPGDEFHTEDGVRVSIEKAEPFLIGVYAGRDGVTQEEYELSLGRVWKISAVEALFYNRRANEVVSAS
jgi:Trypsin-like peptidase domain